MQKMHIAVVVLLLFTHVTCAQELHNDYKAALEATVQTVDFVTDREEYDGTITSVQTVTAVVFRDAGNAETIQFVNDYVPVTPGERVFLGHFVDIDGKETFSLLDIDRRIPLYGAILFFIVLVIFFGRWQGVRSLIALGLSFVALVYVLIPLILAGYSPVLVGSVVATAVLFAAIFLTYGFTAQASIAFIGTTISVCCTGLLAYLATDAAHLTGVSSEEGTYLQIALNNGIDMIGLLIAGIIIGALGVLDDIAVTQVAVVKELLHANESFSSKALYARAIAVGQSHVSALVNTLVLAYTGASLPLLLLLTQSLGEPGSYIPIINMELFATEIIRMVVGSSGLILAVPITTAIAVYYYKRYPEAIHAAGCGHAHHH